MIRLKDVRGALLRDTAPPRGTRTWIEVAGEQSSDILVVPNDPRNLSGAQTPVEIGAGANDGAIRLVRV